MPGPIARPDSSNRSKTTQVELYGAPPPHRTPWGLRRAGKAAWKRYWSSAVAAALMEVDAAIVERWARLTDAIEDMEPGTQEWDRAAARLHQLEQALAIGPAARARLGLKLAETRKVARLDLDG